jgi:hypothetical protein
MDLLNSGVRSLDVAAHHKAFFKIGDAVANLLYTLAKAKIALATTHRFEVQGSPKVSARILVDGLARANGAAGTRYTAKGGAHGIADVAEAILAYGWSQGIIDFSDAETIASPVIAKALESPQASPMKLHDEWAAFADGFGQVLAKILTSQ